MTAASTPESEQNTPVEPEEMDGFGERFRFEAVHENPHAMDADDDPSAFSVFETHQPDPMPLAALVEGEREEAGQDIVRLPAAPGVIDLLAGFFGVRSDFNRRLYVLTHAISIAPDVAVNYVLRGELYMQRGQFERAADDFAEALRLAEQELRQDEQTFGLMAQSVQDRALIGYENAIRRGETRYNKPKRKVVE
ncbi:MAG: tetratricopeptide repeat protein [bacterium]|nr:tetratricopeptide repeat protein [bacterium]